LAHLPQRIVCLTEETTETLYLLGEDHRVVGISGYTVRPPEARQKPRVSAFINAKFDRILDLKPDLVLTFSDLQADISKELIRRGVNVLAFNQRSVQEILNMILAIASLIGVPEKGQRLVAQLEDHLDAIRNSASRFSFRPRVFFEEWNNPLISGICWVDELVETAGGTPIFPELRPQKNAPDRIVDPHRVVPLDPDVIIASWCGARVNKNTIRSRADWNQISAVRNSHIYEIKSTYILQPGPAALTEGVRQLHSILAHVAKAAVPEGLLCEERVDPALNRPE
jgi:iron complex transport system substrate-binding protein